MNYFPRVNKTLSTYLLSSTVLTVASTVVLADQHNKVTFDHASNKGQEYSIPLSGSEYIELAITNTCETLEVDAHGLVSASPTVPPDTDSSGKGLDTSGGVLTALARPEQLCSFIGNSVKNSVEKQKSQICFAKNKNVKIPNDKKYSGYVVNLVLAGGSEKRKVVNKGLWETASNAIIIDTQNQCESDYSQLQKANSDITPELLGSIQTRLVTLAEEKVKAIPGHVVKNTQLYISTLGSQWNTSFSGGVVVSTLTDREYRVSDGDGQLSFQRNKSAEDAQSLKLGAFTHVHHSKWEGKFFSVGTPAITAGISLSEGDGLDYYIGPSVLFGNAALNFGVHWGQTIGLPDELIRDSFAGTQSEAEGLLSASSRTQTRQGIFLSISFTFAGPGESPFRSLIALPSTDETTSDK